MASAPAEVISVVERVGGAWTRYDLDAFALPFSEDAEFVDVVGLWWKGRTAI